MHAHVCTVAGKYLRKHDRHLPQSPAGKEIAYALGQWPHLQVFLVRVDVPPDDNKSERLLRVLARGRLSYLFVGHDEAGQNLAMLMSLVATAEACGKNPQGYLADVLLRVQSDPSSRIDALPSQSWAPPVAEFNSTYGGRAPASAMVDGLSSGWEAGIVGRLLLKIGPSRWHWFPVTELSRASAHLVPKR